MKVLITGATGLVGSALRKVYEGKNVPVHFLTTSESKLDLGYGHGFLWNPAKKEIDLKAFHGVTHVVNLAGATIAQAWNKTNRKRILQSRTQSLETLQHAFDQLEETSVKHILTASAIGIYPHSFTEEYTENDRRVDDSFLGEVVEAWEKAAQPLALRFKTCILRIGIVLDKKEGALPKLVKPIAMGFGAPLGNGKQWQSWIHVQDLVRMIVFAQEENWEGAYNGVGPAPRTQKEMTKMIAQFLKKPLWMPSVPAFALRLLLGEMAYIALASQRVSAQKVLDSGFSYEFPSLELALKQLLES